MSVALPSEALTRLNAVLALEIDLHPREARETISLLLACLPADRLDEAAYLAVESACSRRWVGEILLLIEGERALRSVVAAR